MSDSTTPRHATPERVSWLTASRRHYLYRVLLAAIPILIIYGVLDESTVAVWTGLAAALLGITTADLHVPASK